MTSHARIRVGSTGALVGPDTHIIYIDRDGTETDISEIVQGVDIHLHVGDISRATIHAIVVEGHTEAELDRIVVNHIKPYRRLLRFKVERFLWRTFHRKPHRRVRDITSAGTKSRKKIAA